MIIYEHREEKNSVPVGTAEVEALARVSLLGRKDAHLGSYICQPSFHREAT